MLSNFIVPSSDTSTPFSIFQPAIEPVVAIILIPCSVPALIMSALSVPVVMKSATIAPSIVIASGKGPL